MQVHKFNFYHKSIYLIYLFPDNPRSQGAAGLTITKLCGKTLIFLPETLNRLTHCCVEVVVLEHITRSPGAVQLTDCGSYCYCTAQHMCCCSPAPAHIHHNRHFLLVTGAVGDCWWCCNCCSPALNSAPCHLLDYHHLTTSVCTITTNTDLYLNLSFSQDQLISFHDGFWLL